MARAGAERRALKLLGGRIRKRRRELKRKQWQVAADAGLTVPYLSGVETGRGNPTTLMLLRLAVALQLRPGELFEDLD